MNLFKKIVQFVKNWNHHFSHNSQIRKDKRFNVAYLFIIFIYKNNNCGKYKCEKHNLISTMIEGIGK